MHGDDSVKTLFLILFERNLSVFERNVGFRFVEVVEIPDFHVVVVIVELVIVVVFDGFFVEILVEVVEVFLEVVVKVVVEVVFEFLAEPVVIFFFVVAAIVSVVERIVLEGFFFVLLFSYGHRRQPGQGARAIAIGGRRGKMRWGGLDQHSSVLRTK
jgi:hypothetical protein